MQCYVRNLPPREYSFYVLIKETRVVKSVNQRKRASNM